MLIQAETGVIDITGLPDKDGVDGRAKVGPSVCDISAGMTAYQAILQALIKRLSLIHISEPTRPY